MRLEALRAEIDALDEQLLTTLARRFAVCRDVAEVKAQTATAMMQPGRVRLVKQRAADRAHRYGLPTAFVEDLYDAMIAAICTMEDALIADLTAHPVAPPIFVGGEDRSGTTLVSVILDAHPDVVMGPELDYQLPVDLGPHLRECCRLLLAGDPRVQGPGVTTADPSYAAGVQLARQAHRFGVDHARLDELVAAAMQRTGSDLQTHDQRLSLIGAIGQDRCRATGKHRWGIKIQRSILNPQPLLDHWPGARFVHVVRDGRDVAASHLRGGRDWGYVSAAEAAAGWRDIVLATRTRFEPGQLYEVRYEDLVAEPATTLRPLLDFLGVRWDSSVLEHARSAHTLFDHPHAHPSVDAVREPISRDAVGRYVRDLDLRERSTFEAIASDALRICGYRLEDR